MVDAFGIYAQVVRCICEALVYPGNKIAEQFLAEHGRSFYLLFSMALASTQLCSAALEPGPCIITSCVIYLLFVGS